jgi:hypothetical protein
MEVEGMEAGQTGKGGTVRILLVAWAIVALLMGMASTPPRAYADGKIKSDDPDKWISLGMGIKTSFVAQQHGSANSGSYGNRFGIDFQRFYLNGSIHKYVKFEVNTECFNCPGSINGAGQGGNASQGGTTTSNFFGGNSTIGLLDAIGKFEFTPQVNLWVGRLLVTGERGELNGPFYMAVYDGFKTPFNSADFSGNFGKGGAGLYSRDNGVVFWGEVKPGGKQLQYSLGVYTGLQSSGGTSCAGGPCGPNQQGSLMYAGRLTYNFLDPEKNPGYYTSGTYYGKAGDILALGVGVNHQKDGAGSFAAKSDFTAVITDLLFEKPLANDGGVVTVNLEYKQYFANYNKSVAFGGGGATANGCFCMFDGHSYTGYAMYMFPQLVGIGKFQPYGRFTWIQPNESSKRKETEAGVNYIIDGHNARISAFWQYGDLFSKGLNYAPTATGDMHHVFKLALQLQY